MLGMIFELMEMMLFLTLVSILAVILLGLVFVAVSLILDTICEVIGFIRRKGRK